MCKTNKWFPSLFSFSKNILSQQQKSKQEQLTSCYLHICHKDPYLEQWHGALVRTQRGRTSQTSLLIIQMGTVTKEDMLAVAHRTKYILTIYFSNHAPWDSLHKRWKILPTGKCVLKKLVRCNYKVVIDYWSTKTRLILSLILYGFQQQSVSVTVWSRSGSVSGSTEGSVHWMLVIHSTVLAYSGASLPSL